MAFHRVCAFIIALGFAATAAAQGCTAASGPTGHLESDADGTGPAPFSATPTCQLVICPSSEYVIKFTRIHSVFPATGSNHFALNVFPFLLNTPLKLLNFTYTTPKDITDLWVFGHIAQWEFRPFLTPGDPRDGGYRINFECVKRCGAPGSPTENAGKPAGPSSALVAAAGHSVKTQDFKEDGELSPVVEDAAASAVPFFDGDIEPFGVVPPEPSRRLNWRGSNSSVFSSLVAAGEPSQQLRRDEVSLDTSPFRPPPAPLSTFDQNEDMDVGLKRAMVEESTLPQAPAIVPLAFSGVISNDYSADFGASACTYTLDRPPCPARAHWRLDLNVVQRPVFVGNMTHTEEPWVRMFLYANPFNGAEHGYYFVAYPDDYVASEVFFPIDRQTTLATHAYAGKRVNYTIDYTCTPTTFLAQNANGTVVETVDGSEAMFGTILSDLDGVGGYTYTREAVHARFNIVCPYDRNVQIRSLAPRITASSSLKSSAPIGRPLTWPAFTSPPLHTYSVSSTYSFDFESPARAHNVEGGFTIKYNCTSQCALGAPTRVTGPAPLAIHKHWTVAGPDSDACRWEVDPTCPVSSSGRVVTITHYPYTTPSFDLFLVVDRDDQEYAFVKPPRNAAAPAIGNVVYFTEDRAVNVSGRAWRGRNVNIGVSVQCNNVSNVFEEIQRIPSSNASRTVSIDFASGVIVSDGDGTGVLPYTPTPGNSTVTILQTCPGGAEVTPDGALAAGDSIDLEFPGTTNLQWTAASGLPTSTIHLPAPPAGTPGTMSLRFTLPAGHGNNSGFAIYYKCAKDSAPIATPEPTTPAPETPAPETPVPVTPTPTSGSSSSAGLYGAAPDDTLFGLGYPTWQLAAVAAAALLLLCCCILCCVLCLKRRGCCLRNTNIPGFNYYDAEKHSRRFQQTGDEEVRRVTAERAIDGDDNNDASAMLLPRQNASIVAPPALGSGQSSPVPARHAVSTGASPAASAPRGGSLSLATSFASPGVAHRERTLRGSMARAPSALVSPTAAGAGGGRAASESFTTSSSAAEPSVSVGDLRLAGGRQASIVSPGTGPAPHETEVEFDLDAVELEDVKPPAAAVRIPPPSIEPDDDLLAELDTL